jgi:hypothetical protein
MNESPEPIRHPLIGHWSVVSLNGTALPADGHVTVTFRACGCSMVNAHGNPDLAKLYDASKINESFRAFRGPAPAVGGEVRLARGALTGTYEKEITPPKDREERRNGEKVSQ